jgi:hypothetical protein
MRGYGLWVASTRFSCALGTMNQAQGRARRSARAVPRRGLASRMARAAPRPTCGSCVVRDFLPKRLEVKNQRRDLRL